ncbi:MAG: hypothetical protein J6A73_01645 [Lachnospiraceae bacterium]|nr:hypothetical protein [Lachnospiraceae bacterium]
MKRKNIKRECGLLVLILCIAGTLTGCGILEHFDISGNAEVVSEVISTEPESNTQEVSEELSSQEESEDVSEDVSENSEVAEPDEEEPAEDESIAEPIVELGEIAEADLHALFEEYISNDAAVLLQHYEEAEYAYYDINGDGMDELVLREPENTVVIQYQNGVLVNLCENMYHATLLNDGRVMCYEVDGHYESYVFFEYDNGQYKPSLTMERKDRRENGWDAEGSDDEYLMDNEEVEPDVYTDAHYEQLSEVGFADIAYTRISSNRIPNLPYKDEKDAYYAFLNGECGVYFMENYPADTEYLNIAKDYDSAFYLYDIVNRVVNDTAEGNRGGFFDINIATTIKWAYIDCGNDGKTELALRVDKESGMDEYELTYFIKYMNGRLYVCYAKDAWSRSRTTLCKDGCIVNEGSSGADYSSGEVYYLNANMGVEEVYAWYISSQVKTRHFGEDAVGQQILQVSGEWHDANEPDDIHYRDNVSYCVYRVDNQLYYIRYKHNDDANIASMFEAFDEAGIPFYSEEEVADLIVERRLALGLDAQVEEKEVNWNILERYY